MPALPAILKLAWTALSGAVWATVKLVLTQKFAERLIVIGLKYLVENTKSPVTKELAKTMLLELGVRHHNLEKIEACKERLPESDK